MSIDNKQTSKPAGINNKVEINVISLVQLVEKEMEDFKNQNVKTVVTNSAKMTGILSTDLDLGVTIKAFDGVNPLKEEKEENTK